MQLTEIEHLDEAEPGPAAHARLSAAERPPLATIEAGPATFISARVVGVVWLIAMGVAMAVNPGTTEAIQPTLVLTVLSNVAAFGWLATIAAGVIGYRRTASLGVLTGGFMLAGHFICGFDGHLPMTGGIWITQLMFVAGATAVSALAMATRR